MPRLIPSRMRDGITYEKPRATGRWEQILITAWRKAEQTETGDNSLYAGARVRTMTRLAHA